ncbi:aspartate dehydrogenase [Oceanicella sp. SM1341]|uniref:aspartate dehydrogenase n=1 Tax=Oceanicella sp. SM1341 TaxID=1548889 RepID=UPI000E481E4B|nr:aspartate dehydrogenase [Oceanicella sp. SM1341]
MSASEHPFRIALIGWGAIGATVGRMLAERPGVELVAVAVSDASRPRAGLPEVTRLIDRPEALAALSLDMVIEAAGRASVAIWAEAALLAAPAFAVSSTSAFVDDAFLADLLARAERSGAQIVVPPGALGGIDALGAAALMGLERVEHFVTKPALAWAGTPAEQACDLATLAGPLEFFRGSARAAADAYPKNANVAVISSLAGLGLDRTEVVMVADPGAVLNSHRIVASGAFGRMDMTFENAPLPDNPKSSAMTALNLVRMVENRVAVLAV